MFLHRIPPVYSYNILRQVQLLNWIRFRGARQCHHSVYSGIYEYLYRGDENYSTRFNNRVSHDLFEESLFQSLGGGTAVTLSDGSILGVTYDGSMPKSVYIKFTPESGDENELHSFWECVPRDSAIYGRISDVCADKWGNIIFSEYFTNRISLFRLTENGVVWVDTLGWGEGLSNPNGVCIGEMDNPDSDDDNLIFISDTQNDRIVIMDFDGNVQGEYFQEDSPDRLSSPLDLEWYPDEVDNSEVLYVVDGLNRRIVKLQGAVDNLQYCYFGMNNALQPVPTRLTLDKNGHIYVLDEYQSIITKHKDTGIEFQHLTWVGGHGIRNRGLYNPNCIAIAEPFPLLFVSELYTEYSGGVIFKVDLEISLESIDNYYIDPDIAETVCLEYLLDDYAQSFNVTVIDENDDPIVILEQADLKESGRYQIEWDGKNGELENQPEGEYRIVIQGNDTYDIGGEVDPYLTPPLETTVEIRPAEVHINNNTQWDSETTIYRDLIIDEGATLTLLPGANLRCRQGSRIIVNGTLDVQGNINNRINICSMSPLRRFGPTWFGIIMNNSQAPNQSSFQYCDIIGAEAGLRMNQSGLQPSVTLNDVNFRNCSFGLYLVKTTGTIGNYVTINECGTGIYLDSGSELQLNNTIIETCTDDGIYVHQSSLTMDGCEASSNGSTGLTAINALNMEIYNSEFLYNGHNSTFGAGISLITSSPSFHNTLVGSNDGYGVYVANNSFPIFYDILNPMNGYNTLDNNENDEMTYVEGMAFVSDCHNNFIDDDEGVLLSSYNAVPFIGEEYAFGNYWGHQDGPHAGQLFPVNHFAYLPFDDAFNAPPPQPPSIDDYNEFRNLFVRALRADSEGDTTNALGRFRQLFDRAPRTGFASASAIRYANLLSRVIRNDDRQNIVNRTRNYLNVLLRQRQRQHRDNRSLKIASRVCLAAIGEWDALLSELNDVIRNSPTERDSLLATIEKNAYLLQRNDGPLQSPDGIDVDALGENYQSFAEYLQDLNDHLISLDRDKGNYQNGQVAIPEKAFLAGNYPNPFNSHTNIKFGLSESTKIQVFIFDINGRKVDELANGVYAAGTYNFTWYPKELATGVYFLKLKTDKHVLIQKLLLMK